MLYIYSYTYVLICIKVVSFSGAPISQRLYLFFFTGISDKLRGCKIVLMEDNERRMESKKRVSEDSENSLRVLEKPELA